MPLAASHVRVGTLALGASVAIIIQVTYTTAGLDSLHINSDHHSAQLQLARIYMRVVHSTCKFSCSSLSPSVIELYPFIFGAVFWLDVAFIRRKVYYWALGQSVLLFFGFNDRIHKLCLIAFSDPECRVESVPMTAPASFPCTGVILCICAASGTWKPFGRMASDLQTHYSGMRHVIINLEWNYIRAMPSCIIFSASDELYQAGSNLIRADCYILGCEFSNVPLGNLLNFSNSLPPFKRPAVMTSIFPRAMDSYCHCTPSITLDHGIPPILWDVISSHTAL